MKTLTIRHIDDNLSQVLKEKAKETNSSLNSYIINLLTEATGLSKKQFSKKYNDLDTLAGTWTEEDFNNFNTNTEFFNQIDEDMWK